MNISLNKKKILKEWQDDVLVCFSDMPSLFSDNPDPFLNPTGAMVPRMLESLYDQITGDMDENKIHIALDDYIKLMAVQDCPPSQALGFLSDFKKSVLSKKSGREGCPENHASIQVFQERIDRILLKSFDMYMKCKEQIYTLRIDEFKKRAFRVLRNIQ